MAYVKTTWSTGDTITAALANHWETQYDEAKTDIDTHAALTTAHGSTSAATASAIMQRDAAGRAKVAAPSAVDDIARKDTVDAVQTNLTSHIGSGGTSHAAVTTSVNGFMIAADKTKLDGIEAGATADQTAAEILTAIKTVDGAGSGLDADLHDGHQYSEFGWCVAGDTVVIENLTEVLVPANSNDVRYFRLPRPGRYRVTGDVKSNGAVTHTLYVYSAEICVDATGNAIVSKIQHGTFTTSSASYVSFSIDLTARIGTSSLISIRLSTGGIAGYMQNLRIKNAEGAVESPIAL